MERVTIKINAFGNGIQERGRRRLGRKQTTIFAMHSSPSSSSASSYL